MVESRPRFRTDSLADLTGVTHVIRGLLTLEPKRRKSRVRWVVLFGILAVVLGTMADRSVRELVTGKARVVAARITGAEVKPEVAAAASLPTTTTGAALPSMPAAEPAPAKVEPAPAPTDAVTWGAAARPAVPASTPAPSPSVTKAVRAKTPRRPRSGA